MHLSVYSKDNSARAVAVLRGRFPVLEDINPQLDLGGVVESNDAANRLVGLERVGLVLVETGDEAESIGGKAATVARVPRAALEQADRQRQLRESEVDASQQPLTCGHDVRLNALPCVLVKLDQRSVRAARW